MRGAGSAADRLRAFVRARVHKDGAWYQRGAQTALAAAIGQPPSWVSHYVDDPPQRHADVDTALAICAFFGVRLEDFATGTPIASPAPAPTPQQVAATKLLARVARLPERHQAVAWRSVENALKAIEDLAGTRSRGSVESPRPAKNAAKR